MSDDVQINEEPRHIVRSGRWTLEVNGATGRFNLEWREALTFSEADMPDVGDLVRLERALEEVKRILAGDGAPAPNTLFPEVDRDAFAPGGIVGTTRPTVDEDARRIRDGEVTPNKLRAELGLPPVTEARGLRRLIHRVMEGRS